MEKEERMDRYLRALESGTVPDTVCAPRVAELSESRAIAGPGFWDPGPYGPT